MNAMRRVMRFYDRVINPARAGIYDARNGMTVEHLFLFVPAQQFVGQFLATFKEFPPSQKGGTFNLDAVLQTLQSAPKGR